MKFTLCILLIITIFSCNTKEKNLRDDINSIAENINQDFISARKKVEDLGKFTQDAFEKNIIDNYDITAEESGYDFFENSFYYKKSSTNEGVIFATGYNPVTDHIKKKMIFIDKELLWKIEDTYKSDINISSSWFFTHDNIATGYPYYDVISFVPMKIDLFSLPWAKMAYEKTSWSKDPFISLASGWFMTVATPVIVKDKLEGIVTSDIKIIDFSYEYIKQSNNLLLLMSNNTTLIAMSDKLSDILDTPKLSRVDYLTQLNENPEASNELKLNHKSRDKGLIFLSNSILNGVDNFEVELRTDSYTVMHEKIPEVNFYLIGLIKN